MTDYTGRVTVGGLHGRPTPLPALTIVKLAVGRLSNNVYLLRCTASGEGLLIDAADEAPRIRELVTFEGPPISAILTTHRHPDHWQALATIADEAGAAIYAGDADADDIACRRRRAPPAWRHHHRRRPDLDVIALRGHTPGSVAVAVSRPGGCPAAVHRRQLVPGGVGKTTTPADFQSLIDDVEQRIFDVLPDETWVYPGHGDDTTLGVERPHLGEWRARGW